MRVAKVWPAKRQARTFSDPELESQFAKRGFVLLSLLDGDQVSALRGVFEDHRPSEIEGYHATLGYPDPDTRLTVSQAVLAVVEERILGLLSGHRMIMGTFVVKEPIGDAVVVPHTDPILVDEPRHRSVGIWMPLVETNEENGMLWMLEGSHPHAPTFRQFLPTPEKEYAAEMLERTPVERRIAFPLKPGQALMYDHALVHWSGPNTSGAVRLAASAVALPKKQPLICCWINGRGERERWAVPDEYHVTMVGTRPRDVGQLLKV